MYDSIRVGHARSSSLFRSVFADLLTALAGGNNSEGLGGMGVRFVEKIVSEMLARVGVEMGTAGREFLSEAELEVHLKSFTAVDMVRLSARAMTEFMLLENQPKQRVDSFPSSRSGGGGGRGAASSGSSSSHSVGPNPSSRGRGGGRASQAGRGPPAVGGGASSGLCYDELLGKYGVTPKGCTLRYCKFSHALAKASKEELRDAAKGVRDEGMRRKLLTAIG